MKTVLSITFVLSFIGAAVFNLEKSIEFSLSNSSIILSAKEDVNISRAQTIESRSAALPSIQINSSGTRNYAIAGQPISFPTPQGILDTTISFGREYQGVYGININQTLYNGRVLSAIRAAKVFSRLTSAAYQVQVQSVIENTKIAFFSVLLTGKVTKVVSNSMVRAKNHLEITHLLFNSGKVSELELIRAESSVAEHGTNLATAQKNEILALEYLKIVMGYPIEDELKVDDSFSSQFPQIKNFDDLTSTLLKNQPALNHSRENHKLLNENVRSFYSEFMPSISLSGTYQMYQTNDKDRFNMDKFQKNQSFSVNLSFPLFDGFGSSARVMNARANAKKAQYKTEDVKNNLLLELRKIQLTITETIEKINAGKKNLELAERGLEIADDLYAKGMTTQLDLLGAEMNFNHAELGLIQAKYEYHVAMAMLSRVTGKPNEELYR